MPNDTSLLEKDGVPTIDEIKAFISANDFSTQVSSYKNSAATPKQKAVYSKAKKFFVKAWREQLKLLTGKGSFIDYTVDSPLRHLEEADKNLVAGTVALLFLDEEYCESLWEHTLTSMLPDIDYELEKYAKELGKSAEYLNDEEVDVAIDRFADTFLTRMMSLLLRSQSVPEIFSLTKQMPAHEDFDENVYENHSKIDFIRKCEHTRTDVGAMLPFYEDIESIADTSIQPGSESSAEYYKKLVENFCATLDDETDSKIFLHYSKGYTQKEIAEKLGFKTHSSIVKRLKKIKQKLQAFMETQKA